MSEPRGLVPLRSAGRRSVARHAAVLLAQALASDDAESLGLRADELLADHQRAEQLLGGPDAWASALHAVVQRYGRVGALLVIAYQARWARRHEDDTPHQSPLLELLVERFYQLDAAALDALLADIDRAEGVDVSGEDAASRRWLHATYAVAERDGTDAAHRCYMRALDRVLRRAGSVLAS